MVIDTVTGNDTRQGELADTVAVDTLIEALGSGDRDVRQEAGNRLVDPRHRALCLSCRRR